MRKFTVAGQWADAASLSSTRYTCGYCGVFVGSDRGWRFVANKVRVASIYICPSCDGPTFFAKGMQVPDVAQGSAVDHLPAEVAALYEEIRNATSAGADTLAVLGCRKLLMHIAVEQGAGEGLSFASYVDYLEQNHYSPPNSKSWVDKIRQKGNEANHEITLMSTEDVRTILAFVEMLLRYMYEFPAKASA